MPVGIFTNRGTLLNVPYDVKLAEDHYSQARPTRIPIEDGSTVTDHIVLEPDIVTITAYVANYTGSDRARTAWQAFKAQLKIRGLYDVLTEHELYRSMALTDLGGEHIAPFRGAMTMQLTFTEISVVRTNITAVPSSQLSTGTPGTTGPALAATDVSSAASTTVQSGRVDSLTTADAPDRGSLASQLLGL